MHVPALVKRCSGAQTLISNMEHRAPSKSRTCGGGQLCRVWLLLHHRRSFLGCDLGCRRPTRAGKKESRMEESREMGPCPRSPHSLSLGWVPWACQMECGPQPYLTKLTMEQTDQSQVQPSRLLNTDTRQKHNSGRLKGKRFCRSSNLKINCQAWLDPGLTLHLWNLPSFQLLVCSSSVMTLL